MSDHSRIAEIWLYPHDELYHGLCNPVKGMNGLATAWSDTRLGGNGRHELTVWWTKSGEGKILTVLPGHLWDGQVDDQALRCVGFRMLLNEAWGGWELVR